MPVLTSSPRHGPRDVMKRKAAHVIRRKVGEDPIDPRLSNRCIAVPHDIPRLFQVPPLCHVHTILEDARAHLICKALVPNILARSYLVMYGVVTRS